MIPRSLSLICCRQSVPLVRSRNRALAWIVSLSVWVIPVTAELVFDNGFEGGEAEWQKTGVWAQVPANAYSSPIGREGTRSVGFLPLADQVRSEFTIRNGLGIYEWGTEYWMGYSLLVVRPTGGFGIISDQHTTPHSVDGKADWRTPSGECTFLIKIRGDQLVIHTATDPAKVFVTPARSATSGTKSVSRTFAMNQWYDFVLHFRLATDATGIMEVWMNGEKIVDVQGGPTVYAYDTSGRRKTPVCTQRRRRRRDTLRRLPHLERVGWQLRVRRSRWWASGRILHCRGRFRKNPGAGGSGNPE